MFLSISLIVFVLGIYGLIISLTNINELKKLNKISINNLGPKVSICIPARNEEKGIENCVISLLEQDYNNYEVLVLNDNSTDSTLKILQKISKIYPKLKIINGKPLKTGWKGKIYAMQQLLNQSTGDYVLFTDADTYHKKNSISKGMSILQVKNVDLVTGFPKMVQNNYWSSIIISNMIFIITLLIPFKLQNKHQYKIYATAFGPYLLVKKSSLVAIGGFSTFKDKITDDMNLCKVLLNNGYKQTFIDLSDVEQCNMYEYFYQSVEGVGRSIKGVIPKYLIPPLILVLPFIFLCAISIPYSIIIGFSFNFTLSLILFLFGGIFLYFSWFIVSKFQKFSYLVALSQPITYLSVIFLCFYYLFKSIFSKKTIWKGREV